MARIDDQAEAIAQHLDRVSTRDVSNEPRVPAGNGRPSGEWTVAANGTPAGSRKTRKVYQPKQTKFERAQVVYGETSSLRPKLINPQGNPDDPANWDPDSVEALAKARAKVAAVSGRNGHVHSAMPTNFMDPNQVREWMNSLHAADASDEAQRSFDPEADSFFMRQGEKDAQNSPDYHAIVSEGPFYNTSNYPVHRGNQAFIDFYKAGK